MNDYRQLAPSIEQAETAIRMYESFSGVLQRLRVSPERALAEINNEYSTMTEVADVLLREADVPFRTAHHYASELTQYGREHGKRPLELTDRELRKVYRDAIGEKLPVAVDLIRAAMDPVAMVQNRKGRGGPQPAEVDRMLAGHRDSLHAQSDWLSRHRQSLQAADLRLQEAFIDLSASKH
ncbi:MAG: hypothetical protein OER80_14115 [Gammaproteobacteria bacterium]|nr:hypothetical protein [Gammaproteobacteria bacterium]